MIGGAPSKIPPDFVPRVLASLLPTEEEIRQYSRDQLLTLVKKKEDLEELIRNDPVRFFQPNAGGQLGFMECEDPTKRVRCYFAGNKGGKTTGGGIRTVERLLGRALWDRERRQHLRYRTPARGAVFSEDFDSHVEITVPALLSWTPRGEIKKLVKNAAQHPVRLEYKNGSVLHFRTYDQGAEKAEGKDWDVVWVDEPPPRNVYTAILRGLVATGGVLYITATLLKETWLYDESEHDHVVIFEGTIHDNSWINASARNDFLASLTDDERQVRELGKPASLTGVVYKSFRADTPFVVEPHPIPIDSPIILGVDPHERRPLHCEWAYVTPQDEIVWFKYALIKAGSLAEIKAELREIESEMPSPVRLCIMDPNRGRAKQIGGASWEDTFAGDFGYQVTLGYDNITFGHTKMREYLSYELDGTGSLVRPPRMRWMKTCSGKGGPIHQMLRYSWEDWAHRKIERSAKEKPKDLNKDFPDIHRYVACEQLRYDTLEYGHEVWNLLPPQERSRTRVRAYAR